MKLLRFALLGAVLLSFLGCASTIPLTATSNPVGTHMGEAKRSYLLGFPLAGDGSIYTAAKNGGITKISTVDVRYVPWLFGYDLVTVVSGE